MERLKAKQRGLQHESIICRNCDLFLFYLFSKNWLQHTGSPKSRIEKCEFKHEKAIDKLSFNSFKIIK